MVWVYPLKMHEKCIPVEDSFLPQQFHHFTLHFDARQENQLKTPAAKHFLISEPNWIPKFLPQNDHTLQIPPRRITKIILHSKQLREKIKERKSYKNLDKYTIPGSREINIILKRILSNFYVRLLLAK